MTTAPDGFHDHMEPTWWNQLFHARQLYKEKGYHEVLRHARVSSDNRHRCRECFCCACHFILFDPTEQQNRRLDETFDRLRRRP